MLNLEELQKLKEEGKIKIYVVEKITTDETKLVEACFTKEAALKKRKETLDETLKSYTELGYKAEIGEGNDCVIVFPSGLTGPYDMIVISVEIEEL